MKLSESLVRELGRAENSFLQVLLRNFLLKRSGEGADLSLDFDDETPAIWSRHAKAHLRELIPHFQARCAEYQRRIDSVLYDAAMGEYRHNDANFPFRYASGGVLPILRMGRKEYFAFFYRDIAPVGWNIANGGSDSRAELLYPKAIIEREFREELMLVKPPAGRRGGRRYVLNWGGSALTDHVDHAMARQLWSGVYPTLDVEGFEELPLPVEWLDGPDGVTVRMGKQNPVRTSGVFLNINAEDFGIEVDRVARLYVDEDVVVLDGEIMDQRVLGRPVGLFEVDKLLTKLASRAAEFFPDRYFYEGRSCEGETFEGLVEGNFTRSLPGLRTSKEIKHFTRCDRKYDLCPVTRSITRRYSPLRVSAPAPLPPDTAGGRKKARGKFEVFICCGAGDEAIADRVYDFITREKQRSCFFYRRHPVTRWGRQIGDALEETTCMVLVGSNRSRITRGWPETEWIAFLNAVNTGRKGRNSLLVPFLPGVDLGRVPMLLAGHLVINTTDVDAGLRTLGELLDGMRPAAASRPLR